jgi:hypothetical protein
MYHPDEVAEAVRDKQARYWREAHGPRTRQPFGMRLRGFRRA